MVTERHASLATMTTKFQRVVGAVKDHTSVGLALVALRGSSTAIEVAVLKATSHDDVPVNDRYATEVLLLASSSPCAAAATAVALRRRMTRTSSWVVALKTLNVIYSTILDAGPDFRREAAMHRLLDLSSFRSTPWDFTAFVRTYALYLDARLQSSLQGYISLRRRRRRTTVLKPAVMLDRIQQWQQLLDRAIGTRPTGPAKTNRLVQISLCTVVRETFTLYHDVAGSVSLLLDNLFQLPYPSCVATVEACRKTAKLFEDLNEFYQLCKKIGIGRDSEYPVVQRISKKLLERLNGLLRDHQDSGNPKMQATSSPQMLLLAAPPETEPVLAPTNPFLGDEQRPLALYRAASAGEGEKGSGRSSLENSAWIQNKLDENARQELIHEQKQWMQHQSRMMERNLAFL